MNQDVDQLDPGRVLIHDFRNLLAVIVNYAELIAGETNDPDAIKADIQEIKVAAEKAIAMTEKLPRPGRSPGGSGGGSASRDRPREGGESPPQLAESGETT